MNPSEKLEPETQGGLALTTGILKRQQVADILGISVSEVRRRERLGLLKPTQTTRGVWLFDAKEVYRIAGLANERESAVKRKPTDTYSPAEAAKVFAALSAGKTLVQCVIECLVMPEIVEALAIVHSRMNGCMYLSKVTVDAINVLPLEGTFPLRDESALLNVVQAAAADICKSCKVRGRLYCRPCAVKAGNQFKSEV